MLNLTLCTWSNRQVRCQAGTASIDKAERVAHLRWRHLLVIVIEGEVVHRHEGTAGHKRIIDGLEAAHNVAAKPNAGFAPQA